jgi:hypothetical protein
MKWELNSKTILIEKDLNFLGAEVPAGDLEKNHILMQMVSKFGQIVRKISEGYLNSYPIYTYVYL